MKAKYTVYLKTLMDNPEVRVKINNALSKYPLYQKKSKEELIPSYVPTREELNTRLLNAYKYREIGFETIGRFLEELEFAMAEIMPHYNQLFFSADQDFNIIYNVDYKKTLDTVREGETESNVTGTDSTTTSTESTGTSTATATDITTGSTNGKNVSSETPQNELNIGSKNIDNVSYADNATWNEALSDTNSESESSSTTSSSGTNTTAGTNNVDSKGSNRDTEQTIETTKGNFGVVSAQDLVLKYRETILNIEQMIINDPRITELFMLVY